MTLDELEEQEYITIDDKEYVYDADSDEWYSVGDTEEQNPVSSEEIVGGALTSEEVI